MTCTVTIVVPPESSDREPEGDDLSDIDGAVRIAQQGGGGELTTEVSTTVFSTTTRDSSGNLVPTQITSVGTITRSIPTSTSTESSSNPDPQGLSSGIIAGVIVGVLTFLFLLVAILFIFIKRRRSQRHRTSRRDAEDEEFPANLPAFVASPVTTTRNAALEKENLVLQEKIRDMLESMNRMQSQLQERPQRVETNNTRRSVRSDISDGPPEYQSVIGGR